MIYTVYSMGVKFDREEYRLRVFENRVLRDRDVEWVKMALPSLCCSPNITGAIKQRVRACSTHAADERIT